jgi:hypothetical protein
MKIISQLATSLGKRDEIPNKKLAAKIVKGKDKAAMKELALALKTSPYSLQTDILKVIEEVGKESPGLLVPYIKDMLPFLAAKQNRLVWASMAALDAVAAEKPELFYKYLGDIMKAIDSGSVITRDHGVGILCKLSAEKKYQDTTLPLIMEQLLSAPVNQFPMYVEKAAPVIPEEYKKQFLKIIDERFAEMNTDAKRSRLSKIIKSF